MWVIRALYRRIARWKGWIENILQLLDWADWKTWTWYAVLGTERICTEALGWAKRRAARPSRLVLRGGKFFVVPKR